MLDRQRPSTRHGPPPHGKSTWAEVMAASLGRPQARLPEDLAAWIGRQPEQALRTLAAPASATLACVRDATLLRTPRERRRARCFTGTVAGRQPRAADYDCLMDRWRR